MRSSVSRGTAIMALAAALAGGGQAARAADVNGTAAGAEPTRDQVMQELQALREQVRRLEEKQAALGEQATAQEVEATVGRVIDDADRRSQLLQSQGFMAGWNKGKFIIQSEDGNFVLNPNFWFQLRYVANYREEDAGNETDGDATAESGFELRRMKFIFDGNAFSPKLKYRFQFNTNRSNGNAFLEDAYVAYKFTDLLTVKAGQYKEPTFHEEIMSDTRQLAAERSLVNFALGGGNTDRVQGVALIIDDGPDGMPWRSEVGFTDGPNSDNTNFVDGGGTAFFGVTNPDFGLYGRFEYLVTGDWKAYEDFTALGATKPTFVVGAGVSYAQSGDANVLFHTVDAQYEQGPLGLYAAYYGAASDTGDSDATGGGSSYDAGLLAQAGYMVSQKLEVFGRFEYIALDEDRGDNDDDDYQVFGAGVNYYLTKTHAAKVTLDLSYLPNGTPVNADGLGILDPDADGDQVVARAQFQLLL